MNALVFVILLMPVLRTGSTTTNGPSQCTSEERVVWTNNHDFTREYHSACASSLGFGSETTDRLFSKYGSVISRPCLSCLGDASQCGRDKCIRFCLLDQNSAECKLCFATHCRELLLWCTGAPDDSELPPPISASGTERLSRFRIRTKRPPHVGRGPIPDSSKSTVEC